MKEANPDVKKREYVFMQKHYKTGVYHMDKAQSGKWSVLNRDYNAPVNGEKFDKSNLPAILQKR